MAASQIVWTAVPNGYSDGRLSLSVLVAPRLAAAGTLADYPTWLAWPTVKPVFSVTFDGGAGVPATITSPAPRLDLWQRLFTKDTPVLVPVAPMDTASIPVIRSWPTTAARTMASTTHAAAMAASPTAPPAVNGYIPPEIGEFARKDGPRKAAAHRGQAAKTARAAQPAVDSGGLLDIYQSPTRKQNAIDAINAELAKGYFLGGALGDFSDAEIDFLLADLFHDRSQNVNPTSTIRPLARQVRLIGKDSDLDFQAALSSFAQYPALQRLLGLVVDIAVDPAAVGVPLPADPVTVGLEVEFTALGADSYDPVHPAVSGALTRTAFAAKPSGTTLSNGFLALDTPQFEIHEIDTDAAAGLLSSLSRTLNTRSTGTSETNGGVQPLDPGVPIAYDPGTQPAALPAMKTSGFTVAHVGRAKALHDRLSSAAAKNAAVARLTPAMAGKLDTAPFSAEELLYGIRLDVWDDTAKQWFSLCRRKGTYDVNGVRVSVQDEGIVHTGHTQQTGDPSVYLHESIAAWSGYSLVATRPGSTTKTVGGQQVTVGPDSDANGPVKLKTSFQATGLPKLRYGRTYKFRARTVDITGHGPAPDDPDTSAASGPVTYLRFEAVTSPILLPAGSRTPAESIQVMVIRGNYDAPSKDDCQRHVVPPRIGQLMAEQHGAYDVPPTLLNPGGMDKLAYGEIVRRDKGSLDAEGTADPGGWDTVPYYTDPVLAVPYIPDVLARGVAFRGLPGLGPDEVFAVRYGAFSSLVGPHGFRIRLVAGTGKPRWDGISVLTVQVPAGQTFKVSYASCLDDSDVDVLGVWNWFLRSGRTPPDGMSIADLRKLAVQGQLWQLTPHTDMQLTHAVRQPLTPPTFAKPVAVRMPADTTAKFLDTLAFDRPSTAHVDVQATWVEPIDSLLDPGPTQRNGSAHVTKLTATADDPAGQRLALDGVTEFHDTLHRQVALKAVGASRHVDFFRQDKAVTLSGTGAVTLSPGGIAVGTLTVADPVTGNSFAEDFSQLSSAGGDYVVDYPNGTIARTARSGIADGAAVDVNFVTGSVTRVNTEAQQPVIVNVRSSARPAAPDIAYLIPTFGWEKGGDGATLSSTRKGNGLRVYLRRPWYSSGDGELLGVTLFSGTGELPAGLRQYVTVRGQDPLFSSAKTRTAPGLTEFPLAVHPKAGYRLAESTPEASLPTVAVAPHAVAYAADRQMWYCDITMTQDPSYQPFVRLALARFQPNSLTGVELSPVVLAQFAQLNPDRTLSVVFDGADAALAHLTVVGTSYAAAANAASRITVLAQKADPRANGAVGWTTTSQVVLGGGNGQWTGDIRLPQSRGSAPMRLVVEEREQMSVQGARLVYADAVEI